MVFVPGFVSFYEAEADFLLLEGLFFLKKFVSLTFLQKVFKDFLERERLWLV